MALEGPVAHLHLFLPLFLACQVDLFLRAIHPFRFVQAVPFALWSQDCRGDIARRDHPYLPLIQSIQDGQASHLFPFHQSDQWVQEDPVYPSGHRLALLSPQNILVHLLDPFVQDALAIHLFL